MKAGILGVNRSSYKRAAMRAELAQSAAFDAERAWKVLRAKKAKFADARRVAGDPAVTAAKELEKFSNIIGACTRLPRKAKRAAARAARIAARA